MRAKTDKRKHTVSHSLCNTCTAVRHCAYTHQVRSPITECTEFDEATARPQGPGAIPSRPASAPAGIKAAALAALKGLCRTCENNQTCAFRTTEGGVWRCEEYT